jgi:hypothetical protein
MIVSELMLLSIVLQHMADKKGFELDRDTCTTSIDIEKPIFSPNGTRRFLVDAIIDLVSVKHCGVTNGSNSPLAGRIYRLYRIQYIADLFWK